MFPCHLYSILIDVSVPATKTLAENFIYNTAGTIDFTGAFYCKI